MQIDILIGVAKKGGVENVINLTAPFLRAQGHQVRIVQLVYEGDQWVTDDIPFFPLINGREGHSLADLSDAYQAFLQSGEGKGHPPDLILGCAWPYMTYIAKNVAVNLGLDCKVVSWLHAPVQRYIDAGYGGYEALVHADAHLCLSDEILDGIRNNINNSTLYCINNPVIFPSALPEPPKENDSTVRDCLYYIGRLAPEKRTEDILTGLAASDTSYRLTLIGEGNGDEIHRLRTLAKKLGLADRVTFAGWQDDPWSQVHDDTAALVISSEYEGFCLAAVEALARGIPVIGTPVGILPALIRPGVNGYLYGVGDTASLAKILTMMHAGLFPEIDKDACKKSVQKYESEAALKDFHAKLLWICRGAQHAPHPQRIIRPALYAGDRISVIIPCYNVSSLIGRCLDSVLAQTFPVRDMEIILVDDASTDETLSRLKEYEARYPEHILVVACDKNGGQGQARNTGLSYATGDYCMFIDADDTVLPALAATLYEACALTVSDIAICGCNWLQQERVVRSETVPDAYYDLTRPDDKKTFLLTHGCKASVWAKLYRTSFLRENGILFPSEGKMEDLYFHEIACMKARRAVSVDADLYDYRLNENGTMFSDKLKTYFMDTYRMQLAAYERLSEEGLLAGYEDEFALIFYVKGFVEPMGRMLDGDFGIVYDEEKAALLKTTILRLFPDIVNNRYVTQDGSDYNRRFTELLRAYPLR